MYAQLALAVPLSETRGDPTFSIAIELSSNAHGYLGKCSRSIEGTTKEGAEALRSRSFTVSIVAKPHDDALLPTWCEGALRRALGRQDIAAAQEIRGELRLEVITRESPSNHEERTVASGRFLVDLSGGRASIEEGLAKLDKGHDQERRDAIPNNRMPRSKMPSLEDAAMQAVKNEISDTSNTTFQPLRVVITDREWVLERNPKTSVVIRRYVSGTVAFRRTDKTCFSEDVTFSEEFDGIRFQRLRADLPTPPGGVDLLCENVRK
jgi:hypothetical protein